MNTATRNGFPGDARSAAELYLAKGLAPIPLPTRSKGEGLQDGWRNLRLTPGTIKDYFPPQEVRNIAILNGGPSGNVLDVDLDCREALLAAPLLLPATGGVFGRPSAPRSHWIYRADQPLNTAQEKYTDLDGVVLVELRGTGGLTVYPPSLHRETGERIAWDRDRFDDPAAVALPDLQRAVREIASVSLLAQHWPTRGSRQDAHLALAGGLLLHGWNEAHSERFLSALCEATQDEEATKRRACVAQTARKIGGDNEITRWPRLSELLGEQGREVVRRVREWLGIFVPSPAAPKMVRTLEPYQPFPVEALPGPLGEYVRQGALALGCDPAYLALPALAAASVIGNTRTIRLKRGWDEPSVIWSALVAESGTMKSPAHRKAVACLFRLQRPLLQEFKQARARYQEELREYQAAKQQAKKKGTAPGDPPQMQRIVCSDTTIEKLAQMLADNPRGLLLARDELAGWLGLFARYKGQKGGTDLPAWLEMHQAGTVVVDRKTGEPPTLYVERAAVSITGGIQPGVLARVLTPEFLDAGLVARVLMAMPPKLPKRWSEVEIAPEVGESYRQLLDQLRKLDFDRSPDEETPHVLSLSREAKAAWITFYNAWAKEQAAAEGELAAAFTKLEAYAARFALLHHVVSRVALGADDRVPVQPESIDAGVKLCRWFAREARRIYSTLSETTDGRDARRLIEWIQGRGGGVTAKELQRSNSRKYPTAEAANHALELLVEEGVGYWRDRVTARRGGRPTRDFILHPTTDDTDDTSSEEDDPDDPPGGGPADETPPAADDTREIPKETEVSSVS
jgi:hypothetical protein